MTTLFCPSKPHFFQPLLPGFQSNFLIPQSFLQYLRDAEDGDEVKDCEIVIAKLIDRRKKIWYVKVGSDRRHLEDGWETFCNDHNLQIGDFLVFRHHGNFVFDVFIFDPTSCEREFRSIEGEESQEKEKTPSSDEKRNCGVIDSNVDGSENMGDNVQLPEQALASITSTGCPYFRTIVTLSQLKSGVIVVPTQFAKENGLTTRWCDIVLRNEAGWTRTKLLWYNSAKTDGSSHYILGWPSFYECNGFKREDIICFELIENGDEPIMNYYRVGNMKDVLSEELLEDDFASIISDACPYFRSIVKRCNLEYGETGIPKHFTVQYGLGKRNCDIKLIDEKGRPRTMRLGHRNRRGTATDGAFISGRPPFYQGYGLKKGDTIIFELIEDNGEKPVMKFYSLPIL